MMAELFDVATSPITLLTIVAIFGFAPGFCLRLLVLLYPPSEKRRHELIAELYIIPRVQRPLWVAEQLEGALFEGFPMRVRACADWLRNYRLRRHGSPRNDQPSKASSEKASSELSVLDEPSKVGVPTPMVVTPALGSAVEVSDLLLDVRAPNSTEGADTQTDRIVAANLLLRYPLLIVAAGPIGAPLAAAAAYGTDLYRARRGLEPSGPIVRSPDASSLTSAEAVRYSTVALLGSLLVNVLARIIFSGILSGILGLVERRRSRT